MNWHHQNTRRASLVFRSYLMLQLGMGSEAQQKVVNKGQRIIARSVRILEQWLNGKPYLVTKDHPTLADLLCYCELDQLKVFNLFDFTNYPNVRAWIARMEVCIRSFFVVLRGSHA